MQMVKSQKSKVKSPRGFSIIEAVLAMAVFGVLAAGVLTYVFLPLTAASRTAERARAIFLVDEGLEAARSIRNDAWTNLVNGPHGIAKTASWAFSGASDS